ncbi:hypothetical protein N4R57_01055 [Rhodobacteraceae bacterium D3-12]|nr:hypothetical protein N4R57_01055 [Rhodobacteraceae bacterium D3-12]
MILGHACKPLQFFFALALIVITAFATRSTAQQNTTWTMNPNVPHATAAKGNHYPTVFTIHHLTSEGGHVQARVNKPGQPECYALFDYVWTFAHPLDVVRQGDIISVKIELNANPASNCPPPLDPNMAVTPLEGAINNTAIAGEFTAGDRQLVLWHPKTPSHLGRIALPAKKGDVLSLKVDDTRTSHGGNHNAQRGGFKILMGYRGAVYEAYYLFSNQQNASADPFVQKGWTALGKQDRWCTAELECGGAIPACTPTGANAGKTIQDRRTHNNCVAQGCGDPNRPQQVNQTYVCK